MRTKNFLAVAALAIVGILPAKAQEYRTVLTPASSFGLGFNADTNHPIFSGSLRLFWELESPPTCWH